MRGKSQQSSSEQQLLDTLRGLFEKQNETLAAHGQLLAQQNQRLETVIAQVTTLATQQEALRNDFNKRWDDLPKIYVPRQEHQALGLEPRMVAMEEFRIAALKDISDLKLFVQQQVQSAVQSAANDLAKAQLNNKDDIHGQRFVLDARWIGTLLTAVFTLISIVLTLALHFMK